MHSRERKPVFSSGQKLGVGVANTVPWEDTICSTFVFSYPQSCSLVNLLTELTGQGKHDGTLNPQWSCPSFWIRSMSQELSLFKM